VAIAPAAHAGTAQCAEIASPATAHKRRIRVIAEEVIAPAALFFINETLKAIYSPCQLETTVRLAAWLPGRSRSGSFATEARVQRRRLPEQFQEKCDTVFRLELRKTRR
jgi:hypothetical protein